MKRNLIKLPHAVGWAGLGVGSIYLVWLHVMIALFGHFFAYENIAVIAWTEVALAFYIFGYYVWFLRNHERLLSPTQEE